MIKTTRSKLSAMNGKYDDAITHEKKKSLDSKLLFINIEISNCSEVSILMSVRMPKVL